MAASTDGEAQVGGGGHRFVLVGAGLSRALSADMPLLRQLGDEVLREMGLPPETLDAFDGNLEQWLSYLSVDQPWLSDPEILRNRATFREASLAVKGCIERAEQATLTRAAPAWYQRLVWDWCDT